MIFAFGRVAHNATLHTLLSQWMQSAASMRANCCHAVPCSQAEVTCDVVPQKCAQPMGLLSLAGCVGGDQRASNAQLMEYGEVAFSADCHHRSPSENRLLLTSVSVIFEVDMPPLWHAGHLWVSIFFS